MKKTIEVTQRKNNINVTRVNRVVKVVRKQSTIQLNAGGKRGVKGDTGPVGPKGDKGEQGEAGVGINIVGSFNDPSELPSTGAVGEAYLIQGNLWVWNGSAWEDVGDIQGPVGETGPQGPQGIAGATGPQGIQGQRGEQGLQGIKGDTGATGTAGATGAQGPIGLTGAKGDKGDRGDTGLTGAQGERGLTGDTGPQGPKGDQGDQGQDGTGVTILGSFDDPSELPATAEPGDAYLIDGDLWVWSGTSNSFVNVGTIQGPQGVQGIQGIQGLPGNDGQDGAQGEVGPAGAKGDKGDTGEQGVQGIQGPTGADGIKGDTGATGPQGDDGIQGPIGPQGETGIQGVQGERGEQGLQGATGNTGPKGDTGEQGLQGPIGLTGAKGDKGDTGDQGVAGETGPRGFTGDTGPQGIQGLTGAKGDTGATGLTGETGPQGIQGPKGDQGDPATNIITSVNGRTGVVTGLAEKAELDMVEEELFTDIQNGLATKENAFSKGSLVQGTNVTLTGTLNNRLVGSGDITVSAIGGGGSSTWGGITGTLSNQTDLQSALNGKQGVDGDLTAISALSTMGILTRTAADTYSTRTITGTTNIINVSNGDGISGNINISVGNDVTQNAAVQTLTNKRITRRVLTIAAGTTYTPIGNSGDEFIFDFATSNHTIAAPTGTPQNGDIKIFRMLTGSTAYTITWNAIYSPSVGINLPTVLPVSSRTNLQFKYDSTLIKWVLIGTDLPATGMVPAQIKAYRRVTAATTISSSDGTVSADATSAAFNVTLPDPTTVQGQIFSIKKWNATANNVTVVGTIDTATNYVLSGTTRPSVTVIATSTGWEIL